MVKLNDDGFFDEKPLLEIIYQDEFLVAVNKPSGLFVHKSFMDKHEIYFALQLLRDQIGQYVYPLHRLDRPTSGVLLFALDSDTARLMGEAFTNKTIQKTYFAITRGHMSGSGVVDYALKEKLDKIGDKFANPNKDPQSAQTHYEVMNTAIINEKVGKYDSVRYSLVKLLPVTGRRHQIRRHLAHLRHPIIGDINYGDNKQNPFFHQYFGFKRLMLHAYALQFNHPITKELICVNAKFDEQWTTTLNKLNWHV